MEDIRFSIVVPTYNEEKDIARTLEALEKLEWSNCEVIVVDGASRDRTAAIVDRFATHSPSFTLVRQEANLGVASGRNVGIRAATGEVLVVLNADVLLPADFLSKVAPHYRQGKHWVAVESSVANLETKYARFNQAEHWYTFQRGARHFVWTEAFSCTKAAAEAVGLFPEQIPGAGGEDVDFGLNLEKEFAGVRATDIVVPHIAPGDLPGYWHQQMISGKARTNYYFHYKRLRLPHLVLNSMMATARRVAALILFGPVILAWKYSRYPDRGRKDFVPFIMVGYVKQTAVLIGIWRALLGIAFARAERP